MKPVFISYARGVSYDAARRLCEKLGNAFFDTAEIRPGERFPSALVDALLNCRVFVLFASREYFERKYCRLELCAALATYQAAVRESRNAASEVKHIIVALAAGGGPQLQELPPELRRGNWPAADDLDGLATLIEARLSEVPESLARRLASIDVLSVREMLAEEASMPEPKPLHGIPRHLPDLIDSIGPFYGRVDELHRLHTALFSAAGQPRAASITARLSGGGGFGKTRLALEYVLRYGPDCFPGGLFWINASSAAVLEQQFHDILRALKGADAVEDLPILRGKKIAVGPLLAKALRERSRVNPILFVVDGVPELPPGGKGLAVSDFCPAPEAVSVLTTGRQSVAGASGFVLEELKRPAAILLLSSQLGNAAELEVGDWGRIAEWVGDLPLALDLLNRTLFHQGLTPRALLELANCRETARELESQYTLLSNSNLSEVRLREIGQAFALSFEHLDPESQKAALMVAQLSPDPIPAGLIRELGVLTAAQIVLKNRHFVIGGGEFEFGRMHRVLASFLRTTYTQGGSHGEVVQVALGRIFDQHDVDEPSHFRAIDLSRPHAEWLFERNLDSTDPAVMERVADLALHASDVRLARGDFEGSRRLDESVWRTACNVLGKSHPLTIRALLASGSSLREEGRLDLARYAQQESVLLMLGSGSHLDLGSALNNLAVTMTADEDLAQAEGLLRVVLDSNQRNFGPQHKRTIMVADNLGRNLEQQGRPEEAHHLQQEALLNARNALGDEHSTTLTVKNNLAITLERLGRHAEAIALYEEAYATRTRLHGKRHPKTLYLRTNLATALMRSGETERALALAREGVELYGSTFGEQHPDFLRHLMTVGSVLLARGELSEAQSVHEQVRRTACAAFGDNHPLVSDAEFGLASVAITRGDYPEAARLNRRVYDWHVARCGTHDARTIRYLATLGGALFLAGDNDEARRCLRTCMLRSRRINGPEHPTTWTTAQVLAALEYKAGKFRVSASLTRAVLRVQSALWGVQDLRVAQTQVQLALTLQNIGRHREAIRHFRAAVRTRTRVLGGDDPETLDALDRLALAQTHAKEFRRAAQSLRRLYQARRRQRGPDAAETISALDHLGLMLQTCRDWVGARRALEELAAARQRVQGPNHRDTRNTLLQLACVVFQLQDWEHAVTLFESALRDTLETEGVLTPELTENLERLAYAYYRTGRLAEATKISARTRGGSPKEESELASLIQSSADLSSQGEHDKARETAARAVAGLGALFGTDDPRTMAAMHHQAAADSAAGLHHEAHERYTTLLQLKTRHLGAENPSTLATMGNLAYEMVKTGDANGALELDERTLEGRRKVLGSTHPHTLAAMHQLAQTRLACGDVAGSAELERELQGLRGPRAVDPVNRQARLLIDEHRYSEAELFLRYAGVHPAQDPSGLDAAGANRMFTLAYVLKQNGRFEQALACYATAESAFERLQGECSAEPFLRKFFAGQCAAALRRFEEAYGFFSEAERLASAALGPAHPQLATILNDLGQLHNGIDDYAKAEEYHKRALQIRRNAFGEVHSDVAQSLNNLACTVDANGDAERAKPLYRSAADVWERSAGPVHRDIANALGGLARLLLIDGEDHEAEHALRKAAEICDSARPPNPVVQGDVLNQLGQLYLRHNREAEAEEAFRRAEKVCHEYFAPEMQLSIAVAAHLGETLLLLGKWKEAAERLEALIRVLARCAGVEDLFAKTLKSLGIVYTNAGEYELAQASFHQSLFVLTQTGEATSAMAGTVWHCIGAMYAAQGMDEKAASAYEVSAQIQAALLEG